MQPWLCVQVVASAVCGGGRVGVACLQRASGHRVISRGDVARVVGDGCVRVMVPQY